MDEWKRSGQIPAFGNWDMANELPITQYFECARQAGVVRYSWSSGESERDLYAQKPLPPSLHKKTTRRNRETRLGRGKENVKKQGRVWDVRERGEAPTPTPKSIRKQLHKSHAVPPSACPPPKPVDEDLYKIPPQLLHTTKRNRMLAFFSNCLLPTACLS